MRARLIGTLITLMVCILLALGIPLGVSIVRQHQDVLFQDRLDDTVRFAALAGDTAPGEPGSTLSSGLMRYQEVYGISAAVLDRDGRPLIATPGYPGSKPSDIPVFLRQAFAGRHSADPAMIWPWSHRSLTVAAPVVESGDVVGAVVTVSSTRRMRAAVLRQWLLLAVAAAVAILLFLLLAHRLATWMLRPVRALDAVTHTIATGHLDARVTAASGPPELRRLTASFNGMAQKVEKAMERQRAFVADASHQLRNPLSAVMFRLEDLALALPPGREEEIQNLRREARRLTAVLDDLLELAVAEQRETSVERFDMAALVEERVTAWQVVADQRDIAVTRLWSGPVWTVADPTALGSAFDALIDNALKFSPAGSVVSVVVTGTGDLVEVGVTDEGPGLAPEELARIGDRFWRSPRHQNVPGSGLGLAVARTLLAGCGGRLEIAGADGGGLAVSMVLPSVRQGLTDR